MIEAERIRVQMEIEDRLYGPQKFRSSNKDKGHARIVNVERTPRGFKLKLLERHFYSPGAIEVSKSARKQLDAVASVLKKLQRVKTAL